MAIAPFVPAVTAAVEAAMAHEGVQMFLGGAAAAATMLDKWKRRNEAERVELDGDDWRWE